MLYVVWAYFCTQVYTTLWCTLRTLKGVVGLWLFFVIVIILVIRHWHVVPRSVVIDVVFYNDIIVNIVNLVVIIDDISVVVVAVNVRKG